MALTIPAADVAGTLLNTQVSNLNTLVTNNPNNLQLQAALYQAQLQLCIYLLSNGYLSPATVLAGTVSYVGAPNNQGI